MLLKKSPAYHWRGRPAHERLELRLHGKPACERHRRRLDPRAADRRHFCRFERAALRWWLTLERTGFIRHEPGVAHSIQMLVDPEHLPVLPDPASIRKNYVSRY
jgi:hypothetical protein